MSCVVRNVRNLSAFTVLVKSILVMVQTQRSVHARKGSSQAALSLPPPDLAHRKSSDLFTKFPCWILLSDDANTSISQVTALTNKSTRRLAEKKENVKMKRFWSSYCVWYLSRCEGGTAKIGSQYGGRSLGATCWIQQYTQCKD